jgi:hypothetical protein
LVVGEPEPLKRSGTGQFDHVEDLMLAHQLTGFRFDLGGAQKLYGVTPLTKTMCASRTATGFDRGERMPPDWQPPQPPACV